MAIVTMKELLEINEKLARNVGDLRPLANTIGVLAVRNTRRRMELGVSPDGVKWFVNPKGNPNPLSGRGDLRRSISCVVTDDGRKVVFGTNLIYAPVHQFGAHITPKARRYLTVPVHRISKRRYVRARDIPGLVFVKLRSPKNPRVPALLIKPSKRKYKGRSFETYYLLMESVDVHRREFIGVSRSDREEFTAATITHLLRGVSD